ncbi:efflux RND transporter permease subunit [Candidatus Uabimicrobium sp. HlEnr_7]|uniref:efflux RND transporter permease subunit n=1 Tax=Candidatus Uabimicrobium helgolandensis TaxID=3095367 RepID=UPI0035564701
MSEFKDRTFIDKIIYFFLVNKLVVFLLVMAIVGMGLYVMPFDHGIKWYPTDPVPVDAIPDIGENQQIVFTEWMGRSPQDIEDQITYPLSVSLQGVPGVKTIRSYSAFGFSTIYIIFKDDIDFYWSRSRVLERLSVASKDLPSGVVPSLGPDATGLGQIFWYTLEGRDKDGNVTSGWELQELRSIQDWHVRYALQATEGISEVSSVGGFVKEYQIDVDPDAMWAHKIKLQDIFRAVKKANIDVGAKTIENNGVEYIIRGIGFIKSPKDLENTVITTRNNVPIYIKNVAKVVMGPALRRGAIDKSGAEAVGGVVVVRYGENPKKAIQNIKKKIEQIASGLPKKILSDGTVSQVTIVPFYDRTVLINETLGTLKIALTDEIIITIVVIVLFLMNLKISMLVSLTLPLSVLITFILMSHFNIDSNIMSLSGIAIAIGTIVDMGVIMSENIVRHYDKTPQGQRNLKIAFESASEVGKAIFTAISTTIVSFIPVFAMDGPEGKLFKPLAYTKTFALLGSVVCALAIIPACCHVLLGDWKLSKKAKVFLLYFSHLLFGSIGVVAAYVLTWWVGIIVGTMTLYSFIKSQIPEKNKRYLDMFINFAIVAVAFFFMTKSIAPLGKSASFITNFIVVAGGTSSLILMFMGFIWIYRPLLSIILNFKLLFLGFVTLIVLTGITIGLGFERTFRPVVKACGLVGMQEKTIRSSDMWVWGIHTFPGLGKEFMPPLDEGSYLYMPVIMPHGSIGEAMDVLSQQDIRLSQIPEIETVVGKIGRVESSLDPAPVSMIETIIQYKSEYAIINGKEVRQWRDHIKTPDDIWKEILKSTETTGATSAPKLQPIAARIVMLQSGMRAPMGIKIRRSSSDEVRKILQEMEQFGFQLEKFLKEVPGVEPASVIADRVVGKPYLEFHIDREKIARYGVNIRDVQDIIEIAIGGIKASTSIEGRERYPIRVRYKRELRDSIDAMEKILIPTNAGTQIPIVQVAEIRYIRGPQVIKSEDGFLVSYVLFDKKKGYAEVNVVEEAKKYLKKKEDSKELIRPDSTEYNFSGSYENQVRSEKRLMVLIPICLFIIFMILYFNFNNLPLTIVVFMAIPVALSGGFILIWLYGQSWFLNFDLFGTSVREIFNIGPYNLSVAVWVGFIAVFGIASDDAVVTATYLEQTFKKRKITSIIDIRVATVDAGEKRIRPCLMTTATTILALMPVLMSSGRGSDVMIPMSLPSVGGMLFALVTLFVVPVCYCGIKEIQWKLKLYSEGEKDE